MSEDEEKEKVKIIWVDGIPCIDISNIQIIKKEQNNPVNHPFTFGYLQEVKKREFMPDIIKELDKIFNSNLNTPIFPASWKIYKIENGQIKELKDEDKENDNPK